uniref:Reverse transcriptase RNase H-like domain-containing protein n=1 Tax=Amphimedon queenslandica TaxID=400682 RepID=A0A1X7V3D6_AMPQE
MIHPVVYASRAVNKHERNYGISELETLGLIWSVRYFRSYLLLAYRVSAQESTTESPFFLLFGLDTRIPTDTVLTHKHSPYAVDIVDYREDILSSLSAAWKLAADNIKKAQAYQKYHYDRARKSFSIHIGDCVMVYMPFDVQWKDWKLSRPFHGPYRVLTVTPTNAEVKLVSDPRLPSLFVNLDRIRPCYPELESDEWIGPDGNKKKRTRKNHTKPQSPVSEKIISHDGPVTRSMTKQS